MNIQELMECKRISGYTNEKIAALSGVPLSTVQKIFAGITASPRKGTLKALESVFSGFLSPSNMDSLFSTQRYPNSFNLSELHEDVHPYGSVIRNSDSKQGKYTLEDYYALPDDRRVELIDGVLYDIFSPLQIHQAILGRLIYELTPCVDSHPECELFVAPSDVRLDNDDRTIVQPDLFIVCNRKDNDFRRLNGAPDFICEILSSASRSHDMFLKYNKYKTACVREYWIIDPEKLQVIVHDLEQDTKGQYYTFHSKIPVGISNGECVIDFERIFEKIKRYI